MQIKINTQMPITMNSRESIHWELICARDEIGFTPTPESTPSPEITPTPTLKKYIETPTPTPIFRCEDHYEEWSEDKILLQGEPHYRFKELPFTIRERCTKQETYKVQRKMMYLQHFKPLDLFI